MSRIVDHAAHEAAQAELDPAAARLLQALRRRYDELGIPGVARVVQLRLIDRLHERDGGDSIERAAAHAAEWIAHINTGLIFRV